MLIEETLKKFQNGVAFEETESAALTMGKNSFHFPVEDIFLSFSFHFVSPWREYTRVVKLYQSKGTAAIISRIRAV